MGMGGKGRWRLGGRGVEKKMMTRKREMMSMSMSVSMYEHEYEYEHEHDYTVRFHIVI